MDNQGELFSRFGESEKESRDEALDRVLDNAGDWKLDAMKVFGQYQKGTELTGEDLRMECEKQGVMPHHHNAWGGFVYYLVRSGRLVHTGRYCAMQAPGSHARETKVYRKNS